MKEPKLRGVNRIKPPFPLGQFPSDFIEKVGRQIVYLLLTKETPTIEGDEWEQIFARAIGAEWKKSNVGLDDIRLLNCAWGAKTIKANPWTVKKIRLISGRNSTVFSFGSSIDTSLPPNPIGEEVLSIWNTRVEAILAKYPHVRTVVLIKSEDLLKLAVFEFETVRYEPSHYEWKWNPNKILEGFRNGVHCFTWQPHGSQFTIIEQVPDTKICFRVKAPNKMNQEQALKAIGYDQSWIEVVTQEDIVRIEKAKKSSRKKKTSSQEELLTIIPSSGQE